MSATIEMVRLLISAQMITTAFLAVLLWALHLQLRRHEFNRWWAFAWLMEALFLAVGRVSMAFPPGWSVAKGAVVLLATLFGFLVPPTLVFGAVSLESPGKITRRAALIGLGAALSLGSLSFALSLLKSTDGLTGFSIRNGPRTLVLATALFSCSRVFFRRVWLTKSWAALLTGICCFVYALNQCVYTVAQTAEVYGSLRGVPQGVGRAVLLWSARFLYADIVMICGIAMGMLLLLVEEYQRSERVLAETMRSTLEVSQQNTALQLEIRSRQEVEARLRESEDRYRDLVDNSEDLLCTHDLDGRLLSCNPAAARRLGYDVDELLRIPARELLAHDVRLRFDEYIQLIQRTGVAEGVVKVITRDGERRLWSFRNTLRTDGVARPVIRGMGRDITDQLRAERARKEAQARHEAILRALPDWVFLSTGDGLLLECRAKDTRYLLMPPSDFIGKHVTEVLPTDLALKLVNCYHEALASDQPATLEYSIEVNEELRYYEVRSVRADQDQVLSLVRDVTDQKRAEQRARDLQEELAHTGRVTAIGALTGSLAHEINQPLTGIQTNAFVALKMLEVPTPNIRAVKDALGDIVADNRRIDEVVRRLRGLLRKERRDYATVDLNAIITDVLMLARSNFIERRIAVDVRLTSELPSVLGDRVQLQQVVLNLLMNAADAMTAESADDRLLTIATTAAGPLVTVSVADYGIGATEAALTQMFDPFFTTKSDGMGLGLSICRAIIDAHGGEISAKRNADRGLTCWFTLRAAKPAADAVAPAATILALSSESPSVADLHS